MKPLEETDPELANYFMQIVQGKLKAKVIGDKVFYPEVQKIGYKPVWKEVQLDVGRNDPCICGSEKKFKKCCGANS